jgi:hypothetical protein
MALILKKDQAGRVLGKIKYDPSLILTKKGIRIIDGMRIEVTHFINPKTYSAYWVANSIQTNIFSNLSQVKNGILCYQDGRKGQVKTRYYKPVILAIHDWRAQSSKPQMLNHLGEHLSGTNIYGESDQVDSLGLCLGGTYDYFDINLFDSILYSKANSDLGWRGGKIEGGSKFTKDENGKKVKVFEVSNWEIITKCKQRIPEEIYAYANALLK